MSLLQWFVRMTDGMLLLRVHKLHTRVVVNRTSQESQWGGDDDEATLLHWWCFLLKGENTNTKRHDRIFVVCFCLVILFTQLRETSKDVSPFLYIHNVVWILDTSNRKEQETNYFWPIGSVKTWTVSRRLLYSALTPRQTSWEMVFYVFLQCRGIVKMRLLIDTPKASTLVMITWSRFGSI